MGPPDRFEFHCRFDAIMLLPTINLDFTFHHFFVGWLFFGFSVNWNLNHD